MHHEKDGAMPLVDIQVIAGTFSKDQKQEMIAKVTDTMVKIEGEALRPVTWVRIHEIPSGEWGIGDKGITVADVRAMQSGR
jgi:4-oxalocrotonate tautomerase